jgi:hypothetical protein
VGEAIRQAGLIGSEHIDCERRAVALQEDVREVPMVDAD